MKVSDLIYTLWRLCQEILKKFARVASETYNSGRSRPSDNVGGGGGGPQTPRKGSGPRAPKKDPPLYKKTLKLQILNKGFIYIFSS